ncbi:MAG: hypothetical protein K9H25_16315 [Rhodospirillum sp.]|nr:hypothetical protein [Rhodospirillum sp.]MCF8489629.1 hypothetical protein [Rhodospirillum sp.]
MTLTPRAILPAHLFSGGETVVWFSGDGVDYRDLGLLSGAVLDRTRSILTRWEDQANGGLAPVREDPVTDRLDLLFEAREWNAETLRAALLGTVETDDGTGLTLTPFARTALGGFAQVTVRALDGPALTWRSGAILGPRGGNLPLSPGDWLGLPLRLTLIPPFEPCALER